MEIPPRENIPHRISGEIVELPRSFSATLGHLNAWLWLLQGMNNLKRSTSAPRVVVKARLASFVSLQLMHTRCAVVQARYARHARRCCTPLHDERCRGYLSCDKMAFCLILGRK